MAMYHVVRAMPLAKTLKISFPKQDLIALLLDRDPGVYARMNIYSMLIHVHRWEFCDPIEMRCGHNAFVDEFVSLRP
jgi:hypothetical protein